MVVQDFLCYVSVSCTASSSGRFFTNSVQEMDSSPSLLLMSFHHQKRGRVKLKSNLYGTQVGIKDLLPRYASQCAWVVARLPVHVVTLLKSSELARGVQSPHKDENPSPDMKQVGRVQFACGQMDDDPLQQCTAQITAEERGEE